MESLRRKRKGLEILPSFCKSLAPLTVMWPRLSLGDYSRQRKKYKEDEDKEAVGSSRSVVKVVFTAPPCRSVPADPLCRGLKRKIGCIDVATQLGRKKKIEKEYDLGASIGQGKFGSVVLCRSKVTGEEFACKMLRKGEELVHREVEIMQHLSGHPGVVTLKAVYEDLESFYLVMELCTGGRLLDQMAKQRQYPEHRVASILKEVVSVIKYCHDMGVVHRDIKPENILLTASGLMKLADFGLAVRMSNGQSLRGAVGSPAYVAPEVLAGDYSEKVDIWSAGVLLHTLLVGVLPFQGDSLDAVFEAIKKVNLDFKSELWESVSQPARELVAHMLTRDVSARLTADEILGHPWILFYTEPTQKELNQKPKFQDHATLTSQQLTVTNRLESERYRITASGFLSDDSSLILSSDGSRSRLEEQDCGLVDALTVAISRVRISEPKRSRLCWPTSPIRQECSSNIKINNLCTAF
ncbi:PREDICTED: serine/threonine-protein kinase PEPKR2-like [Populus euphratica]|uniref:Serine/threonine-protein kinase PEPKR2-like n=1 Tax=Populus euphratica TaxID=75702 RepID=A0AAJ6TL36_POPEU|nr:PREDICTED: serine/threonine-protein kinase PEPKR2-like [Populus euphratica]XP_011012730.1 PREDICTED: serine/threonine-protein kinase PEPKR2-like [Populus euphratica]XP_011012731.1 PREDICTED: serine/threonine-protein kinase PEPKR2-like [Populus euphratica]XP_011012732.1 PREDICTED: serine/threonine-protein kinase PEPKR2-like [Populus euphratica]